jgi:hypothetical protein
MILDALFCDTDYFSIVFIFYLNTQNMFETLHKYTLLYFISL